VQNTYALQVVGDRHDVLVDRTETGRRFIARCSCGYVSATRTMERLALSAGVHHIAKTAGEARRNGLPKPGASIDVGPTLAPSTTTPKRASNF
jgi:hypothetical protein